MGIEEVLSAPQSPWQSPYVERLIGTILRDLLNHVIVFSERHLQRLLGDYLRNYYHPCRCHQSLGGNSPEPRLIEPPALGKVVAISKVGGLHHFYRRSA